MLMKKGIESLRESVLHDCNKGEGCFNPNGCDHEFTRIVPQDNPGLLEMGIKTACRQVSKCFHKYCDRYAFIISLAKHYESYFGVSWEKFLEKWETDRTYWYMNFYQRSFPNFEKMIGDGRLKIFDTVKDLQKSTGKEFRCPSCMGISKDAYECTRKDCDWKSYGLFGTMGKGVSVFVKENLAEQHFFMPIKWEKQSKVA